MRGFFVRRVGRTYSEVKLLCTPGEDPIPIKKQSCRRRVPLLFGCERAILWDPLLQAGAVALVW
jgi:hypothetical protein